MTTEPWVQLLRDLGFPAGVAFFVLWRLEGALKELTREVHELVALLRNQPTRSP